MPETNYQWNAEDYARNSTAQFTWAQELIGKLALRMNEAVLDIGCGDGKVSAEIARQVPKGRVVGIDRSWQMVALAQSQYRSQSPVLENLAFLQMDAARIGFYAAFSVVFSNAALHWVRDQRGVLAGVANCLKPGGRFLFQFGGKGNAGAAIGVVDRVRARPAWKDYFQKFSFPYTFPAVEEYQPLLDEAGLRANRVELLPKDMPHAGPEKLAGWIRTTWLPFIEPVPADRREQYVQEIIEEYIAEYPADEQGVFHAQMVRLEVEGEKPA
jgi:trans-aconitate 2-methyltransferase